MSESKEDGGDAFPRPTGFRANDQSHQYKWSTIDSSSGMSLRDYFAAAAMQGILADDALVSANILAMFGGPGRNRGDAAAIAAYAYADALLKARQS
jgi:hypothetical protein